MSTILIYVLESEDLIKVVYTQGNSPKQTLEEYPNCVLQTHGGQVKIFETPPRINTNPVLTVPVSRTIIRYIK